ncbi:MAG: antitoxin PrlF [Myxococcota bacterium]|jgi:antitoxin PrlF
MPATTITSKGQVTLPKAIRDAMGVRPGDRVRFTRRSDGTVVVEPDTVDVRTLEGMLQDKVSRTLTVEEMNAAIGQALTDTSDLEAESR